MTDTFNYFEGISEAAKLLFPVPHANGKIRFDQPIERASEYGQNNAGGVIAVWNYTERAVGQQGTWQGADAIRGFVIMNTVPSTVAAMLLKMLRGMAYNGALEENPIGAAALRRFHASTRLVDMEADAMHDYAMRAPYRLSHLRRVVGEAYLHGVGDIYTTNEGWVKENLSPAGPMLGNLTGVMKRDSRDVCRFYRSKDWEFFVDNNDKNGFKSITPNDLVRSYRTKDGGQIDLDMIPVIDADRLH